MGFLTRPNFLLGKSLCFRSFFRALGRIPKKLIHLRFPSPRMVCCQSHLSSSTRWVSDQNQVSPSCLSTRKPPRKTTFRSIALKKWFAGVAGIAVVRSKQDSCLHGGIHISYMQLFRLEHLYIEQVGFKRCLRTTFSEDGRSWGVCVYIYTYIHIYYYTYIHISIYTYIHIYIFTCIHVYM